MQKVMAWLVQHDGGRPAQEPEANRYDPVLPSGILLIVLYAGFRAWTLFPSWFYADDQRLLIDAKDQGLSLAYLTSPFDSQFMPLGRLVAALVVGSGDRPPSWFLAATLTLSMLVIAGAACLTMLVVAFGRRWEVLPLLALFLTSTAALPASMWWAASLNQLPMLIIWCGAVTAALLLFRTSRPIWAALVVVCLAVGLSAYIKALLVIPVLAWLALSYFARGSLMDRVASVGRRFWWFVVPLLGGALGVAVAYRRSIPQPFTGDSVLAIAGPLADRLLGTSWASSAVGGPWRWLNNNPPVGVTAPPDWAVHAAWMVVALTIAYAALHRRRTGRAWGLLVLVLLMDYALLLITRAPFFGAIAGNEMRYITESSAALCLVLGLVFLPLRGAVECSEPRPQPYLSLRATPAAGILLTATIVCGSVLSSAAYVRTWHHHNPGEEYLTKIADYAHAMGTLDLVDDTVPDDVMASYTFPYNTLSALVPLRSPWVKFPDASNRLHVVTDSGRIAAAEVAAVTRSRPGPSPGCGWKLQGGTLDIPLRTPAPEGDWWMSIGYLASDASSVRVTAGNSALQARVNTGLGELFVHLPGSYDDIMIQTSGYDTTLCVDRIEVGLITSGDS